MNNLNILDRFVEISLPSIFNKMESRYGIGINNRYALFLDEEGEEGEEGLTLIKPKPTNPAKENPSNKNTNDKKTNSKAKDNAKSTTHNREDKENRSNDKFSGKKVLDARKAQEGPRESREDRNNRRNRGGDDKPVGERSEGRSNRGGASRGGRGGGVDRGNNDRKGPRGGGSGGQRKREYERKSGDDRTGVKSVEKREGGGSHNWGTFEDDIKAEDDKANTSSTDEPKDESKVGENGENLEDSDVVKDDEPKTLTLDEWKASQAKKDIPKFNVRKAGEGSEIDPKWKKTTVYKKEKEFLNEDDEYEEPELYPQRVNRQKRVLDIEFSFTDNNAQRGGREGGRGGRGGRGRGGDRRDRPEGDRRRGPRGGDRKGGRGGGAAPNVMDEKSFPTLG